MSSYDGDGTYDGNMCVLPLRDSQIKGQNMGFNGRSMHHHGSSFDQESCPGCAIEKRSGSTNSVMKQI